MNAGLLGALALRFSTSPENLATEGLLYVLHSSLASRSAFEDIIRTCDVETESDLRYDTQRIGDGGEIPDMVALDKSGRERLIVEAKFWASLTDNQPVRYLDRLPVGLPGLLLFITPSARFGTLWPELIRRCVEAGQLAENSCPFIENHVLRAVRVSEHHALAMVSWRELCMRLKLACQDQGDFSAIASIDQLAGLCERMDANAFLPLTSEELGSGLGRRYKQFIDLASKAVDRAIALNVAARPTGRNRSGGWYPLVLCGNPAYVCFNPDLWEQYAETPLWLRIDNPDDSRLAHVLDNLLSHACFMNGIKAIRKLDDGRLWIPLYPVIGKEETAVLDDLVDQLRVVSDVISSAGIQAKAPPNSMCQDANNVRQQKRASLNAPLSPTPIARIGLPVQCAQCRYHPLCRQPPTILIPHHQYRATHNRGSTPTESKMANVTMVGSASSGPLGSDAWCGMGDNLGSINTGAKGNESCSAHSLAHRRCHSMNSLLRSRYGVPKSINSYVCRWI
ncbi:MAG: hypothetical protein IPG66_06105 [Hydrogenophilales bacterium]|nr:hypothetical protein [Hydrogenophilales bacterium]